MAAGSHFGCPKITSYHFRSIPQFIFLLIFFTKWLPAAILDVRNSLSMAFLAISDQYDFFFENKTLIFFWNFWQNGCCRPFWMSEINFRWHFWSFQINTIFFLQNGCRCNRLKCPLARMSGLQCFNMGHNGHGINLYGVSMTLWKINMQTDNLA